MPTVEITEDQREALCRGESITIEPPPPKHTYTTQLIERGRARQTWHQEAVPGNSPRDAVDRWLRGENMRYFSLRHDAVKILRDTISKSPFGVVIAVSENGESTPRYHMHTQSITYFTARYDGAELIIKEGMP